MSNSIYPTLPGITSEMTFTPTFSTKIQTAVSGKEYRVNLMANPTYDIQLNYEFLRGNSKQEMQALIGFYLARQGSYDSFLFRNVDDCAVTDQLIGTGDSRTVNFQLVRGFGPEWIEPVQNVDVLTNVKVGGVVKVANTDYTVSNTGMVTFAVAPGVLPVTWTGTYFYRARFTADTQEFDKFMNQLWSASQVDMTGCLGTLI
jgi:uncharacterized protein (TIGR02217 family)